MDGEVLELEGEITIGDKALQLYNQNKEYIDLAHVWHEKFGLPFVFAKLCLNNHHCVLKQLATHFVNSKIKIPYYIQNQYAKKLELTLPLLHTYLSKISYTIGPKEKRSLKRFKVLSKPHL